MLIFGFLGILGFHEYMGSFSGKNSPVYCVYTIIGSLWEFFAGSSGSSRSTGRTEIEVNPSKMDPWFPTPGSRMTVVFHKTPSHERLKELSRSYGSSFSISPSACLLAFLLPLVKQFFETFFFIHQKSRKNARAHRWLLLIQ